MSTSLEDDTTTVLPLSDVSSQIAVSNSKSRGSIEIIASPLSIKTLSSISLELLRAHNSLCVPPVSNLCKNQYKLNILKIILV